MTIQLFVSFIIAVCASYCLLSLFIPFLEKNFPDSPNLRSSHSSVTPRGGGFVFVLIPTIVILLFNLSSVPLGLVLLISLPLAALGFLDDRLNLPASLRYSFQVITAFALVSISPLSMGLLLITVPFLVFAVTSVINFTNFMDGLDGLVAGSMVVLFSAAFSVLAGRELFLMSFLIGSILGFLVWNWNPARVFMGDGGSTFLGSVFAGLVLLNTSWSDALGLLLVATPLLGDAFLCVPRRLLAGQRVFDAHCLHLFQRLHLAGWSHSRVSILYIVATALLAIALLCGGLPWVLSLAALELLIGIWLDHYVAVSFVVAARN